MQADPSYGWLGFVHRSCEEPEAFGVRRNTPHMVAASHRRLYSRAWAGRGTGEGDELSELSEEEAQDELEEVHELVDTLLVRALWVACASPAPCSL